MNPRPARTQQRIEDRTPLALRSGWALLGSIAAAVSATPDLLAQSTPLSQPERTVVRPTDPVHFTKSSDCALCHSFSPGARAMRDSRDRNVAPYDLWSGSMMANSAVDPYWRAAVSAEVVATPTQKAHIEEVCTRCHAPMSAPVSTSPKGELLAFLHDRQPSAALGKDGVSCSVCHQISRDNLGTDASFTGGFQFNSKSEIYGPHANPVTMPMQRHVGYTPTQGNHIMSSAMCATCHTVITESFDKHGAANHAQLHEQAPYLEWRNSIFNDEDETNQATGRSCQSCHVPQSDGDGNAISTRLAHNPGGRDFPFLNSRQPYGRHTFAGGNTFMTKLLRDNRDTLKIGTPADAFDRVIEDSRRMLQRDTARLTLTSRITAKNVSTVSVAIKNLSGHKFPTAYPSRRAWIELLVRDPRGKLVFESGRVSSKGLIVDGDGQALPSELAGGPIQPHWTVITRPDQVQIYETFMQDTQGQLTFALLRGSQFQKDNRLLPQGWSPNHAHAQATQPRGIQADADFAAGTDIVHYQVPLPSGQYKLEARLLFQSLSSRYVAELLEVDTPEVKHFAKLYRQADLTPETIATATMDWTIP